MNKLTLCLIFITHIFNDIYAESFSFRDKTTVSGKIFWDRGLYPNAAGIILAVDEKLYFHHYPYVKGLSCAPPTYLPYYSGPNPVLPLGRITDYSIAPRCTPSRISFYNFENHTLDKIKKKIAYSRIPAPDKLKTIKMIDHAMTRSKPDYMEPSSEKTRKWQRHVNIYGNWFFKKEMAVWGKDLVRSRKDIYSVNGSR